MTPEQKKTLLEISLLMRKHREEKERKERKEFEKRLLKADTACVIVEDVEPLEVEGKGNEPSSDDELEKAGSERIYFPRLIEPPNLDSRSALMRKQELAKRQQDIFKRLAAGEVINDPVEIAILADPSIGEAPGEPNGTLESTDTEPTGKAIPEIPSLYEIRTKIEKAKKKAERAVLVDETDKVMDALMDSGITDFEAIARTLHERSPGTYEIVKPYLKNAYSLIRGLDITTEQSEEIFHRIEEEHEQRMEAARKSKRDAIDILNEKARINRLALDALSKLGLVATYGEMHVISLLNALLPDDVDPEGDLAQDVAQLSQINMTVRQMAEMCEESEDDEENMELAVKYLIENGTNADSITPFLEASPWTLESFKTQS